MSQSALLPIRQHLVRIVLPDALVWIAVAAGGGDDYDFRVQPSRKINEGFKDASANIGASALDDEGAFGRSIFRTLRQDVRSAENSDKKFHKLRTTISSPTPDAGTIRFVKEST